MGYHSSEPAHPAFNVRAAMQELFSIYAEMVMACGGPSFAPDAGNHKPDDARVGDYSRRMQGSASVRAAVSVHVERLFDFYRRNNASVLDAMRAGGGVRLAADTAFRFDEGVSGAMSLFVDTQLIPDPVLFSVNSNQPHRPCDIAECLAAAQHILTLRPLVDASLPIVPLIVYHPVAYWLGPPKSFDEKFFGPMLYRNLSDGIETRPSAAGAYLGWPDFDNSKLRYQMELCEALRAEPLMYDQVQLSMYSKHARAATKLLQHHGHLSTEAAVALQAFQQVEFRWLQGVPVSAIPRLLERHENGIFRERLASEVKQIKNVSLKDLDVAVKQVRYALDVAVTEYNNVVGNSWDKYVPQSRSVIAGGAIGGLIAGGLSYALPYLSYPMADVAQLALGSTTAIGVAAGAATMWAKGRYEEYERQKIAQRSLFGVIARAHQRRG